jgi:hypothetical protein
MYIIAFAVHHALLEDLLIIIRPNVLQMRFDLRIVTADMLTIPPITSSIMVREGSLQPLQRQIRRAHDSLPHVIKAVDHMPVVVLRQLGITLKTGVHFDHGKQAMQLVRHGGREDSPVLIPHDGGGQVVVQLRPLDVLEAHADWDQLVPGLEGLGLEEVGGVIGREGLVDSESRDLGGDCTVLVCE